MAEKNVSELKDLLTKAVKAMEGLADTEEGDSKTERLIPLQISPQAAITKPNWSGYFPTCTARRGHPRQLLIESSPARNIAALP